ncbi:ABC transporter substrate-binding protein [Microbacterium betulae]|uniref:ABC transporter substrate-binding protein n=1 Tax=Microbacterium betulae TaxID=2981139 RepID=A0AA97I6I5_9MICO|nr:ABC transporter substrate-binding protein [Microbacterium sp. AB]WOF23172.1 ABC transporter substrate-binding protein [Microbacterium sp. AB]
MAISKKQGIAIGAAVAVVAVIAGGIAAAFALNQPDDVAEAASPEEATEANVATDEIEWVRLDAPVDAAVAALEESGFEPVEEGKLTVAHSSYLPPLGYIPEGETLPAGTEPNIGALIADALGLEYNPVEVAWADWPLGIESGKYDLITSNVTVTEERKERFDFASYRVDLLGFAVRADSDIESIEEAADISGLTIQVGSGTNQEQVLLTWNEELEAAGSEPAELVYYDDNAAATLALQSGRIDATFGPNATAAWSAVETGDTKVVGLIPGGWPLTANIAAATAKGNGLVEPVQIALDAIIEGGQYAEVLDFWGLESEAVETSEINPPGLPAS